MTLEQFAYVAEIVGVIVIAITLIYLAIQTRQNNSTLEANARQMQFESDRQGLVVLSEHADLCVKLVREESLSEEDQMRMTLLWQSVLRNTELLSIQYKKGVVDEATWDTQRRVIAAMLSTERMQRWWDTAGGLSFSPAFKEIVKSALGEKLVPSDHQVRMFTWDT